jgi:hypothetical protein
MMAGTEPENHGNGAEHKDEEPLDRSAATIRFKTGEALYPARPDRRERGEDHEQRAENRLETRSQHRLARSLRVNAPSIPHPKLEIKGACQ